MDRRKRIFLLLSLLILWGVFLFFYEVRDLNFTDEISSSFFVRNLSWQTDFLSHVPYKKGDLLEYSAIFSGDTSKALRIAIDEIRRTIDIEEVRYNDVLIPITSLDNLAIQRSGILKIVGRAKQPSNEQTKSAQDSFAVTELRDIADETTEPELPKETQSGTLDLQSPADISLSALKFNSNIPNLLQIRGKHLGNVESVNIGWASFRPIFSSGILNVELDRDAFSSGEYFVFFTLKNGKIQTLNAKLLFEHSPSKINIAGITPETFSNDEDRYVVLQGNGFDKIVSVQLSNNLILKDAEFKTINEHVAGVKIPKGLAPGKYYFNIMDTASIYELNTVLFTITAP